MIPSLCGMLLLYRRQSIVVPLTDVKPETFLLGSKTDRLLVCHWRGRHRSLAASIIADVPSSSTSGFTTASSAVVADVTIQRAAGEGR